LQHSTAHVLLKRYILVPWLLSSLVMFGLSYVWHGVALTDLQELPIPQTLYFILSGVVYLVLGLVLTIGTHKAIEYEFISLKRAFPLFSGLLGAAVGFFVYLAIFILGMSFSKQGMVHVLVDVLWQMFEQGIGGFMVSMGIVYDMHQTYLESEQSS
jgi:uncharacterized integral membrane protein